MNRLYFICAFVLLCNISDAQNLIPNADWENGQNYSSYTYLGTDWTITRSSPDRIVVGSSILWRDGLPAQSGIAYALFNGPVPEAGMATLLSPIISGNTYSLSYYLNIDTNYNQGLSRIKFRFPGADSIFTPFISYTGGWQYFDTTFIASGFATEIELSGEGANLTKIDNMSLSVLDIAGIENQSGGNSISIYPNPFSEKLNITVKRDATFHFILYDIVSRKMMEEIFTTTVSIKTQHLAKGIYFYEIKNNNDVIKSGKIIKN